MRVTLRSGVWCAGLLAAAWGAPVAALNMEDGQWLFTIQMELRGKEFRTGPPAMAERCISRSDVAQSMMPADSGCRVVNAKEQNDTLTWQLACSSKKAADMKGEGRVSFYGTRLEGSVNLGYMDAGYPTRVTQKIQGRRVGDCRKPLRNYDETTPRSPP